MFTHRDTRAPEPMQALVYEELSLLHFFTIERLQPQEWPWQNHDSLARVSVKPGLWTLDWTHGLDCGLRLGLDFGLMLSSMTISNNKLP